MAKRRLESQWQQTSNILAAVVNSAPFTKRRRPVSADELNPYADKKRRRRGGGIPITADNIRILKTIFVDTQKPSKN